MDIVVFCYNRPDKLKLCLHHINPAFVNTLWIFCDGPKQESHKEMVHKTIEVAHNFQFPRKKIYLRPFNYGTPRNVISALDEIFNTIESCFILEDDCIVRPEAYAYVSWALSQFQNDKRVFSINTMAPLNGVLNEAASFLIKNDFIFSNRLRAFWGWATWADRWKAFRADLDPFKNPFGSAKKIPLHYGLHVRYTISEFEKGRVGGWDARLMTLTTYANKFHVHPKKSLMRNIGLDGTGLHFKGSQLTITNKEELLFSEYVPGLNFKTAHVKRDHKIVAFLNQMYNVTVWARSKIFAYVPKAVKMDIRKKFVGKKNKYSQF